MSGSKHGPIGLLALKFPGCEIWVDEGDADIMLLAVVGSQTARVVAVNRKEWSPDVTAAAILQAGRLYWGDGEFCDALVRPDPREHFPTMLADRAEAPLKGLTRRYL